MPEKGGLSMKNIAVMREDDYPEGGKEKKKK